MMVTIIRGLQYKKDQNNLFHSSFCRHLINSTDLFIESNFKLGSYPINPGSFLSNFPCVDTWLQRGPRGDLQSIETAFCNPTCRSSSFTHDTHILQYYFVALYILSGFCFTYCLFLSLVRIGAFEKQFPTLFSSGFFDFVAYLSCLCSCTFLHTQHPFLAFAIYIWIKEEKHAEHLLGSPHCPCCLLFTPNHSTRIW